MLCIRTYSRIGYCRLIISIKLKFNSKESRVKAKSIAIKLNENIAKILKNAKGSSIPHENDGTELQI